MAAEVVRIRTIHRVFLEFLDWRTPALDPEQLRTYRETIAFFEAAINAHAVRGLSGTERGVFRDYYVPGKGYRRRFAEIFGPEKIPAEIRYFLRHALYKYSPRPEVLDLAPNVLADLCSWLVWKDYVPDSEMEEVIERLGAQAGRLRQDSVNF